MGRSENKMRMRMTVDALMAAALVLVMATALVKEAPHEYLGIALIVLMCAHIVLHRTWIKVLTRGRWTPLRAIQAIVIVGLMACLIGQAISAVVLSKHALAFLPAIQGAALMRRVHMMCSYWMFMFAAAHVGLQIKALFKPNALSPTPLLAARVAIAAVSILGAVSFVRLGLPAYLTGSVQFAAGNPNILLACAQWMSVGVLVATIFYCLRAKLQA